MSSPEQMSPVSDAAPDNDDDSAPLSDSGSSTSSSSVSSKDEPSKSSRRTKKSSRDRIVARMLNLCKEVTIMCVIAVAYAALTNESLPKVSKSPAAYPFFGSSGLVKDWYKGQITEAIEQARAYDVAFVMFYAPWDAESQVARNEFEKAARFMHKYVTFSAINCWQPGSECKRQYSKVYKWPVFIAYPTHGRGIQYNGPLDATHMIRFLQNVCKPLILPEKINDVIAGHDAVVLGYVDLLPGSLEFAVFYLTALRFLEKDPFRDVTFTVLPKSGPASIHIFTWNTTITYEDDWQPDTISSWISKNLRQVTGWVSPSGTKSLSLSNYVQPGPTLILFTPRNPLNDRTDYYDMLKEVAYEFNNCDGNPVVALKQKLVRLGRLKNRMNHRQFRFKCLGQTTLSNYTSQLDRNINVPKKWSNTTIAACSFAEQEICDKSTNQKMGFSTRTNQDLRSSENLQKIFEKESCRNFLMAEKYTPTIFERDLSNDSSLDVTGLSCRVNRSLTLVAMDTLKYHHFAEKLGVDVLSLQDKSAVVIIDEKAETFHIMNDRLNGHNVRAFIRKFIERSLRRSLLAHRPDRMKNTPSYPIKECNNSAISEICIKELNTSDFFATILQPKKAVLVFYYSKQCAFCSGVSYTYLNVARILRNVTDIIFTRIDGDLQPLPWEYTMETYPTILFFPSEIKSESRAFPRNVPITVPNLIGFVLTNLEPVLKLKSMWAICEQTKFMDEKMQCLISLRREVIDVIGQTLRLWRSVDGREKPKVVRKLQLLRNIHLLFAHSPEKSSNIAYLFAKLQGNSINGSNSKSNEKDLRLTLSDIKDEL